MLKELVCFVYVGLKSVGCILMIYDDGLKYLWELKGDAK